MKGFEVLMENGVIKFFIRIFSMVIFMDYRNVDNVVRCWIEEFEFFVVGCLKEVCNIIFDLLLELVRSFLED